MCGPGGREVVWGVETSMVQVEIQRQGDGSWIWVEHATRNVNECFFFPCSGSTSVLSSHKRGGIDERTSVQHATRDGRGRNVLPCSPLRSDRAISLSWVGKSHEEEPEDSPRSRNSACDCQWKMSTHYMCVLFATRRDMDVDSVHVQNFLFHSFLYLFFWSCFVSCCPCLSMSRNAIECKIIRSDDILYPEKFTSSASTTHDSPFEGLLA
ncbi:hypothetical protein EV363DRAFT_1435348 [Boletus edulis]|nr:hypothetical protein EV363DRAFT_1435348 [Boletus edulis]